MRVKRWLFACLAVCCGLVPQTALAQGGTANQNNFPGGGSTSIIFPFTVSGATSGGIPCFDSATDMNTSGVIASGHLIQGGGAGACVSDAGFSGSNVVVKSTSGTQTIQATGANLTLDVTSTGAQTALDVFPGSDLSTAFTIKNAAKSVTLVAVDTTSGGNGLNLTANGAGNALTSSGPVNLSSATSGDAFIVPVNGNVPNTLGSLHWLSGSNFLVYATGNGGGNANDVIATAHLGTGSAGTNCGGSNQFLTGIFGGQNAPTCGSLSITNNTSQKNETGTADANVLTFTPPASAGTYRACVVISVSAATSGVISWTLSWTDSNGNAQSNIVQDLFQDGTAAPATTFTTSAAGNYHFCREFDINNAAASVVVKWVGGGTTTAKMSAAIERII